MDANTKKILEELAHEIKKITPEAVNEFNQVRLKFLEQGWGEKFSHIIDKTEPGQKTQEKTKLLSRAINNCFLQKIQSNLKDFIEANSDGYDYRYKDIKIEDKNTCSTEKEWTGNGFSKEKIHLLKKFEVSDIGEIEKACILIIEVGVNSKWKDKDGGKSNYSTLSIHVKDVSNVIKVWGDVIKNKHDRKFATPILKKII
jgi:hypothetical protein